MRGRIVLVHRLAGAPQSGAGCSGDVLCYTPLEEARAVDTKVIDDISRRIGELVADTPVEDVQKNLRALLSGWFTRLELVTREEFDVQQSVLHRTREKLSQMETRVAELERLLAGQDRA